MTSQERVLTALNHQEPDRVPIDFSGHRSSGIAPLAYKRLRRALGLKEVPLRIYAPIQQLAIVDGDVLNMLGVDTIELGRAFALNESDWVDWVLADGTPCKMPSWAVPNRVGNQWFLQTPSGLSLGRMPEGGYYFDQCHWPLLDSTEDRPLEDILQECMWAAVSCPPGPSATDAAALTDGARRLRKGTDRAILGLFGGSLLELSQHRLMEMLAGEPRRVHGMLDRLVESHLRPSRSSSRQLDRLSTPSFLEVIWVARRAPCSRPRCIVSFSNPGTARCGNGQNNSPM